MDTVPPLTLRRIPDRRQQPDRRAQWRGGRRASDFASSMREVAARILGEFAEQPGLMLTLAQATRLLATDVATCDGVLRVLVERGALLRTPSGQYVAIRQARQAPASMLPRGKQRGA